jgi:diacylglycerol kinase family enzyme
MVSIMNGRRMGGGFMMAPSSSITDGQLNICMVREVPQFSMFGLMAKFIKGTHEADPAVSVAKADRITLIAKNGVLPVHADGNTVGEACHEITVELLPHSLEIITRLEN